MTKKTVYRILCEWDFGYDEFVFETKALATSFLEQDEDLAQVPLDEEDDLAGLIVGGYITLEPTSLICTEVSS